MLDHLAAGMNPAQGALAAGAVAGILPTGCITRWAGCTVPLRCLTVPVTWTAGSSMSSPGCWSSACPGGRPRPASAVIHRPIGRELDRDANPRTGAYQPEQAHRLAWERQRRPKPSKLSRNPVLRAEVQGLLTRRYSPEQASGRLRLLHPDDPAMRVSHETIYQSIYLYPRGGLKRELQASLRSGRGTRRGRGRRERMRGKIIGAVPIGARPPEVQGRLVPGHHEGDLVIGSATSTPAVGTIVERTTGYLTLLHLPDGTPRTRSPNTSSPPSRPTGWFARTLTWDRGTELARHARITAETGISVYFADPHAPWQRGSNENINGLLREYLPKGTDLSPYTAAQLQQIEDELNDRPRKRFGWHTPREELDRLLTENQTVRNNPWNSPTIFFRDHGITFNVWPLACFEAIGSDHAAGRAGEGQAWVRAAGRNRYATCDGLPGVRAREGARPTLADPAGVAEW